MFKLFQVKLGVNPRVLKKKDECLARIVAMSYKGDNPKIGLTMRQPGLGKLEWIKEEKKKALASAKKIARTEKSVKKVKK